MAREEYNGTDSSLSPAVIGGGVVLPGKKASAQNGNCLVISRVGPHTVLLGNDERPRNTILLAKPSLAELIGLARETFESEGRLESQLGLTALQEVRRDNEPPVLYAGTLAIGLVKGEASGEETVHIMPETPVADNELVVATPDEWNDFVGGLIFGKFDEFLESAGNFSVPVTGYELNRAAV